MELPLGAGTVEVSLPTDSVDVATPPGGEAVSVRAAAGAALDDPHGPRLADRVSPDDSVAVVVTDVTRPTPDDVLLDLLLGRLESAGVARDQVSVVVGLGLHRPMSDEELAAELGDYAALAENHDPDETVAVGSVDGVDVEVNETVAAADRVLSTGRATGSASTSP